MVPSSLCCCGFSLHWNVIKKYAAVPTHDPAVLPKKTLWRNTFDSGWNSSVYHFSLGIEASGLKLICTTWANFTNCCVYTLNANNEHACLCKLFSTINWHCFKSASSMLPCGYHVNFFLNVYMYESWQLESTDATGCSVPSDDFFWIYKMGLGNWRNHLIL